MFAHIVVSSKMVKTKNRHPDVYPTSENHEIVLVIVTFDFKQNMEQISDSRRLSTIDNVGNSFFYFRGAQF
jgi:hypothetical protein